MYSIISIRKLLRLQKQYLGNAFSSKMVLNFLSLFLTSTSRKLVSELDVLALENSVSNEFKHSV